MIINHLIYIAYNIFDTFKNDNSDVCIISLFRSGSITFLLSYCIEVWTITGGIDGESYILSWWLSLWFDFLSLLFVSSSCFNDSICNNLSFGGVSIKCAIN